MTTVLDKSQTEKKIRKTIFTPDECVKMWVEKGIPVKSPLRQARYGYDKVRSIFSEGDALYNFGRHFALAIRAKDKNGNDAILCNADKVSVTTSKHQGYFFKYNLPHVPFSALEPIGVGTSRNIDQDWFEKQTGETLRYHIPDSIRYRDLVIVDYKQDSQEQVLVKTPEGKEYYSWKHTPGAVLLRVPNVAFPTDRDKDVFMLCGMDDGHYFACQIPAPAETIEDAFASLKPKEIREAEEAGKEVLRQGDVYFVNQGLTTNFIRGYVKGYAKYKIQRKYYVNDSHFATEGVEIDGEKYVWGYVRHSRGQHKRIKLQEGIVYKAVQNLKVAAWQASGKVD